MFRNDEFYTIQEIVDKLKISKEAIYRHIKKGELRAVKVGKVYRVLGRDINKFLGLESEKDFFEAVGVDKK